MCFFFFFVFLWWWCCCYLVMLVHWRPALAPLCLSVCGFVRSRVFVESVLATIDRKERLEQESLKRRQATHRRD